MMQSNTIGCLSCIIVVRNGQNFTIRCLTCIIVFQHSQKWALLRHNLSLVMTRGRMALCLGFLRPCCRLP